MKAPNTPGSGKICIFRFIDDSPGLDASISYSCVHRPWCSLLSWTRWWSDMQRHQQHWPFMQVLFVILPAHLKACSHRWRKGLGKMCFSGWH